MTSSQETAIQERNELERLQIEIRDLRQAAEQRDQLVLLCQAQLELLHEIAHENLVIGQSKLQEAGPALRTMPAASLRTLVRIVEDLEGDETQQAWTGLSLGQEVGLARATRDRLLGPLEQAGIVEQMDSQGDNKARRYRLCLSASNTLSERIALLEIRFHSVLVGAGLPTAARLMSLSNTLPARITHQEYATTAHFGKPNAQIRQISSANTLSERIPSPLVCMYVDSESPDLPDSTTYKQTAWSATESEAIREAWDGLGLSRDLKRRLHRMEAETALGLLLHVRAEGKRPGGLLRSMLDRGSGPEASYVEQARRLLSNEPDLATQLIAEHAPDPTPIDPPDPALDEAHFGTLSPRDIWNAVKGQLKLQLNHAEFGSYLDRAEATRFEDGTLWVRSRHAYAERWFVPRQPMIDHIASGIAGTAIAVRVEKAKGADRRSAPTSSPNHEKEYTTK